MVNIEVSPSGLRSLSTVCGEQAAIVTGVGPPPSAQSSFEATSAAVRVVHATVGVASEQISARLYATGSLVAAASGNYSASDEGNRTEIDAVPQGLYEV